MKIGNLNINCGEKKQGFVSVYKTGLQIPITVICGIEKGDTILLTSGIHCAEYVGIEAALELAQKMTPDELKGQVIIIHPVNISGFEQCNYNSKVPEDHKNLNRVFPGSQDGTVSEQIADFLVKEFQSKADYYIDMHGGNTQDNLAPYVYYVAAAKPEVMEKARKMACRVNVNYMVGSTVSSQGSYNYAGTSGIPSILIERGCAGVWSLEEVELYKNDIKNVMRYLGILKDQEEEKEYQPVSVKQVEYLKSNHTGCWYPAKKAGDIVKRGELAGEIKDYFGNMLEQFYFQDTGVILYQTCTLCTYKGEEIVVYGKI
ncbi:M14 family metallopeptidase [Anaerosacchariphilus polymeriproducens]|nr:M14 family metallopeptidase [Anaerosacchariphilus polymeriproducens]